MSSSTDSLEWAAYAFPQAVVDQDFDQIARFFAEDAIAMYPGWKLPVLGRAANRQAWVNYYNHHQSHPLTTDVVVTAASNDVGYSFGLWATTETDEPGAAAGRYVVTWKRHEQGWEIVVLSAHVHEDIRPFVFQPQPS